MPTISAAPLGNPQIIMVGTPPDSNLGGEVFNRMRKDGNSGTDEKLSWHEWSIDDMKSVDISDHQVWANCNPALGIRLDISVIEDEFKQMSPDGFARERLSYWLDAETSLKAIDAEEWAECETNEPPKDEQITKLVYGVKFSSDGALCALAVAAKHENGVHLEIVEHRSMRDGIGWLVEWLVPRLNKKASTVVIDGLHWSGSLIEQLRENGVKAPGATTVLKADEFVTACSSLVDAVHKKSITHYGQQTLTDSVVKATKRPIGNKGGWGFDCEDSTPVEAISLALFGVKVSKRNPMRKQGLL